MSLRTSLQNICALGPYRGDLDDAWSGTPLTMAVRCAPEVTRVAMMQLVKFVSDTLDMNKRLKSTQEYMDTVERLIDNDYGRMFTLEDFRYICERMIEAKYYERCKFPEFLDAWRKHDQTKTAHAHVRNRRMVQQQQAEAMQRPQLVLDAVKEAKEREPNRPDRVDWMRGASRMTWAERAELQQRDRDRRNGIQS